MAVWFGILASLTVASALSNSKSKAANGYVVLLQAGEKSTDGHARMLHALLYSLELKKAGNEVVLIFDGAGTTWVEKLAGSKDPASYYYHQLLNLGVVEVLCDYCSMAYRQKTTLQNRGKQLTAEFAGHPSLVKWTEKNYVPLIL